VLSAGEVGQEKGEGIPCRFLPACSFRYSNVRFRTAGFWSESETARHEAELMPRVNDTARLFFGRIPNPNSICKGSDILDREKLARERLLASDLPQATSKQKL
jgi:hypothetical protein